MKNIKLKNVLNLEGINEGIKANLIRNSQVNVKKAVNTGKENFSKIVLSINDEDYDLESALYVDLKKEIFLFESRLFRKYDDSMINAYFELLDKDLNIIEEYQDDVWSYGDFKMA